MAAGVVIRHDERAQAKEDHGERVDRQVGDDRGSLRPPKEWRRHKAEEAKSDITKQVRAQDKENQALEGP